MAMEPTQNSGRVPGTTRSTASSRRGIERMRRSERSSACGGAKTGNSRPPRVPSLLLVISPSRPTVTTEPSQSSNMRAPVMASTFGARRGGMAKAVVASRNAAAAVGRRWGMRPLVRKRGEGVQDRQVPRLRHGPKALVRSAQRRISGGPSLVQADAVHRLGRPGRVPRGGFRRRQLDVLRLPRRWIGQPAPDHPGAAAGRGHPGAPLGGRAHSFTPRSPSRG